MTAKEDQAKFVASMEQLAQGFSILSRKLDALKPNRYPLWAVISLVVNGVFLGATIILVLT